MPRQWKAKWIGRCATKPGSYRQALYGPPRRLKTARLFIAWEISPTKQTRTPNFLCPQPKACARPSGAGRAKATCSGPLSSPAARSTQHYPRWRSDDHLRGNSAAEAHNLIRLANFVDERCVFIVNDLRLLDVPRRGAAKTNKRKPSWLFPLGGTHPPKRGLA